MGTKILVICPTRERTGKLKQMLESFQRTAIMSEIRILIDNDDPFYTEYINLIIEHNLTSSIRTNPERTTTTAMINRAFRSEPGFQYYSVTNDDFIYHTPGWDKILTEEIEKHGSVGIGYGDDGLAGIHLPTTSVISGQIVRAVGWLQLPGIKHLYGDNVWATIGKSAGVLFYRPDVKIEHRHPFSGKTEHDATSRRTNNDSNYTQDHQAFIDWITGTAKEDIQRVLDLIKK